MNYRATHFKPALDSVMGNSHSPSMINDAKKLDKLYGEMPFTSHLVTYKKNDENASAPFWAASFNTD